MKFPAILKSLLPWIVYPGVMSISLLLQFILLRLGIGTVISSYLAITVGIGFIVFFELFIPYKKEWKPNKSEVKTDLIFAFLIQILLPKFLTLFVAITLVNLLKDSNILLSDYWIHESSIFTQVLLMIVIAEFFRYWLHRAAHNWYPLWRLHAVHHSPEKLYWLNTSRFHPLEKSLQFLLDALPFILLGVSSEVVATYFVFYAVNGFFQHSNINIRMGWLNYIISSAQLHRWHHSKVIKESNSNYGNNLIIWDIIFGTWFLPKNKTVADLGLLNPSYPMGFTDQMKTPFTPKIDRNETELLDLSDIVQNIQVKLLLFIAKIMYKLPFERSLHNPMKEQNKLLMKIISTNKNTEYGLQQSFHTINSFHEFIQHIPIQDYENLRDFIERQEQTKTSCLTEAQPNYYAVTSGTTGKPKYIPVLKQTIKQYHRALSIYYCAQNKLEKEIFSGKILAFPGAHYEGILKGGSPYGSISGLMYNMMPKCLQKKHVVPIEVFSIENHKLKYQLIIRLALQYPNLFYIVAANPSTYLKIMEILNEDIHAFINDIKQGTFCHLRSLPEVIQKSIIKELKKDSERAQSLEKLTRLKRKITYSDIWPDLKFIATWKGGSCGIVVDQLKKMLPKKTTIMELGYLASEVRGSIPLEDTGDSGVPTFHDNFFEFIQVTKYEQGNRDTLTLNQLTVGEKYFVIITTSAGLYRYFMNDIIEVTGFKEETPLICFVQKGKGVTNITGEKLSENQLILAMKELHDELNIDIPFYIAITDIRNSCYRLYIEFSINTDTYPQMLDNKLQNLNTEYASKRASGRLKQIIIHPVKDGTGNKYKKYLLDKGQRESQFKYLLLQHENDCDFSFEGCQL